MKDLLQDLQQKLSMGFAFNPIRQALKPERELFMKSTIPKKSISY